MSQLGLVVLFSGALFCTAAQAGATLHIGSGANTPCATGGCPIFIGGALNGEVNNFPTTGLDIYQTSGGAKALQNVLLILAIPNNTVTLTSSTITGVSLYAPYPGTSFTPVPFQFGTTKYGINDPSGFAGLMTSGDIYSFLGVPQANNSNSFTNWAAAELRMMGTIVTDFGVYVYSLNTSHFSGKDLLNVSFAGVPEGTFAVAFGEDFRGKSYATPFTEAGLQDRPVPVPEPSTLALFGGLLLALAGARAFKRA